MNFILVAIGGYFLLSIESVLSKFLLTGKIKSWQTYVFYVGIFSAFSFLLFPFGLEWVGWKAFSQMFFSGILLCLSLVFLFQSLIKSAASRVYTLFGVVIVLTTLVLNFIEGQSISSVQFFGIVMLTLGGFFISYKFYKNKFFSGYKKIILAGILNGASLVILKQGFNEVGFIGGYVFSRVGMVVMTVLLLLAPSFREAIKSKGDSRGKMNLNNFAAVLGAKSLAGLGSVLLNYAIFLGSVATVNALVSIQYLFTFFLATILAFYFKKEMQEKLIFSNLVYKAVGVGLIVMGVLFVGL